MPQLPKSLPLLLDGVINEIEVAEHRIDDLNGHVRRQAQIDFEGVQLAFEVVQGIDQLRFGDDQRLLRLFDLQGELRDFRVLGRAGRAERLLALFRQLLAQLLEVVPQQFDVQFLVADLQLLLQKSHEAARLRRAGSLRAATAGGHVEAAEARTAQAAESVQAGAAKHAAAARRPGIGGRTPRHHVDIKRLLIALHGADVAEQRAFRDRQPFEDSIPPSRSQQRLNEAEVKQRDRGVAARKIEHEVVREIHHQIGARRERLPHREPSRTASARLRAADRPAAVKRVGGQHVAAAVRPHRVIRRVASEKLALEAEALKAHIQRR